METGQLFSCLFLKKEVSCIVRNSISCQNYYIFLVSTFEVSKRYLIDVTIDVFSFDCNLRYNSVELKYFSLIINRSLLFRRIIESYLT